MATAHRLRRERGRMDWGVGHLAVELAVLAATGVAANSVEAQGLPSERVLPLSLASEAAAEALAACEERGYRVSVAVVDRAGLVKVLLRGDGAGAHTLDSSSRKAYTAASLRHATTELVELMQNNPSAAGLREMNEKILILGGGLPITAGDQVVGGIGVGGAPGGDKDEACAKAGIDKIRERLG
jgi:uncharacterized protein GlcG (DUF336 family)